MSIISSIQNAVTTTFADVEGWVVDIVKGLEVAATDLENALNFLAAQTPYIDSLVQEVMTLFKEIVAVNPGLAQNATVTAAIADVNNVATALNAFANAANTGNNNAQAVVAGYVAYQNAVQGAAAAKAAIVSAGASAQAV